jgi:uncharacterized RDD family membrane protein YckC
MRVEGACCTGAAIWRLTGRAGVGYDAQPSGDCFTDAGGRMYCSKCGANVEQGKPFCSACGQPVTGYSVGSQGVAAPATSSAVPPAPSYSPAPLAQTYPVPAAAPTVAYAGFWLRFVALIIDFIIIYCVRALIFLPFGIGMGMRGMFHGTQPQSPADLVPFFATIIRIMIISTIIQWLYFSLMESSAWQATLGKKALGLTVTDLEGRRISFGRATGRYFAKIISSLILFIGYIMAGFTEKKQALHDMIAGTLVLRKL